MNVAEELIAFEDRIDRTHVERRLEDWKTRVSDLYVQVGAWLPSGWLARPGGDVPMNEELMRKFGIPEQRLPVLIMENDSVARARLEPRGLWIIGANGRVDLTVSNRHYLIVDRSENFEHAAWMVASLDSRRQQRAFDRQALLDCLS